MKKIVVNFFLIMLILGLSGCGKDKVPKPVEGRYVSLDGDSCIVLSNYSSQKNEKDGQIGTCNLWFKDVDFSDFQNFSVQNSAINYKTKMYPEGCSDNEMDEIIKMFENQIDINKQFSENKALFTYFYSESEKAYGFQCEIEGSGFDGAYENYVTVEYRADDNALICNEIKYILEE